MGWHRDRQKVDEYWAMKRILWYTRILHWEPFILYQVRIMVSNLNRFVSAFTATKIPFMYSFSANFESQFPHSCVCERFIYSQDRSTYFLQQNRQIDQFPWKFAVCRYHIFLFIFLCCDITSFCFHFSYWSKNCTVNLRNIFPPKEKQTLKLVAYPSIFYKFNIFFLSGPVLQLLLKVTQHCLK